MSGRYRLRGPAEYKQLDKPGKGHGCEGLYTSLISERRKQRHKDAWPRWGGLRHAPALRSTRWGGR